MFSPFTKQQISDCSKLKGFADDNFKLDENGGELSKREENNKYKREIAHFFTVFKGLALQTHRNIGFLVKV